MPIITICSSANFYKQAVVIKMKLEALGYEVCIPLTARRMEETGDFDVSHYKTWYGDADDYHKKTALMDGHFNEISKGDAVLVLNYEKHGVPDYIGGNVLMEMAIAFYLKKPIYILNSIPAESPFLEEIIGLGSKAFNGELNAITSLLPVASRV